MNKRQASNFLHAVTFAEAQGRSLNMFVTLNFAHTSLPPEEVSAAFERLRDNHFTRWLRYRSRRPFRLVTGPATYVWAIENASGQTHVHWLVHVPRTLIKQFKGKVSEWMAAVVEEVRCEASAIHIEPAVRPAGLGKYLMKGVDPRYANFYRVDYEPQGLVHGKRCGVSKSLGPAARARPQPMALSA